MIDGATVAITLQSINVWKYQSNMLCTLNLYKSNLFNLKKKKSHIEQNRIDSPEIKAHIYGQLTYVKRAKNIQRRKDGLFYIWYWGKWPFILHHTEKPSQNILKILHMNVFFDSILPLHVKCKNLEQYNSIYTPSLYTIVVI